MKAHSARGLPAEGKKKGVLFMNRITPSTSELYLADADGSNERKLLGNSSQYEYHASFSPDGQWIVFTTERHGDGNSDLYRCRTDGTGLEKIVAMPSPEDAGALSPDGGKDLATGERYNLTNMAAVAGDPSLPDGGWIAFASDRNTAWRGHGNGTGWEHTQQLSVYVIRPDGSGLRTLTSSGAHAVWSKDGRILYSSGMYGFRDEAAIYDQTFQPYGQIVSMNADGSNKTMLTDSLWEDSMPLYVSNEYLN